MATAPFSAGTPSFREQGALGIRGPAGAVLQMLRFFGSLMDQFEPRVFCPLVILASERILRKVRDSCVTLCGFTGAALRISSRSSSF